MTEKMRPRIVIPEFGQKLNNYTNAVYAAGMEPVVVSLHRKQVLDHGLTQSEFMDYREADAVRFDGLLIPGGADINPEFYGEDTIASLPGDWETDALQFSALRDFIKLKKPVLGICRGMQLINIFFGGTLVQNLPEACKHMSPPGQPDLVHTCRARKDSWIAQIYGESFPHNSSHHQGVKELGVGLEADSWSTGDNVVESFRHSDLPIFGVQWHPERMSLALERADTVNGLPVFEFFCTVCGGDPDRHRSDAGMLLMEDGAGI